MLTNSIKKNYYIHVIYDDDYNILRFIYFILLCLDDYLSVLPTEILHLIARWLNILDRKSFMQTCVRFSKLKAILLSTMPGAVLRIVSDYDLSLLQLQSCFQCCLSRIPSLPPSITKNLSVMYKNMTLSNAFKHFVICGIDGCRRCRSTEQWNKVLPLRIYLAYLCATKQ